MNGMKLFVLDQFLEWVYHHACKNLLFERKRFANGVDNALHLVAEYYITFFYRAINSPHLSRDMIFEVVGLNHGTFIRIAHDAFFIRMNPNSQGIAWTRHIAYKKRKKSSHVQKV